ncbi:serine/threonine-protein kinase [Nocardioides kongjuensis]|uniref:non-specific serine/threonine protein kinase n=1 Tax=Nocardioides kongjuensis TaxID=349522 RepID=A0A852RYJ9_9ACTN|nr:serine/threonine-protein kinase [Nocardioides kongjuensis]NYD33890.1 serine/threonine-protein kinase [Nocardioides kongjuensis]
MDETTGGPTWVGGYEVIGRVGAGATGTVFKARDPGLGRFVALKRVPPGSVGALRAEASRLALLDDPHVVSVYGFVEEPDAAYLVLEWVEGATLAEVLATGGRLLVPQALGVCRGALLGLSHTHARGVVHGDVSTSNVLVDTEGTSRLIDFGVGGSTPAYRPPEARIGGPMSPASDVYAAAAVLVHLLTGHATPDTVPDLGHVDHGIRPVLATALAPEPAQRYPDAAAFLAALEDAAGRTYGAAWWTTAGIPALVAPAIATLVPIGGGAAALGGAVVGATITSAVRRAVPWQVVVGAGVAAVAVVAGAITAVAVTRGDGDATGRGARGADASTGGPGSGKEVDPVVDTVPNGEFTYREVVTASDDPAWAAVGQTAERIWTFTADCDAAQDCGGSIVSTSGATFAFTWDGSTLSQTLESATSTTPGDCVDQDGKKVGVVTIRSRHRPHPTVYVPSGPVAADTGLAQTYTGTYRVSERIIRYDAFSGPSQPRDCPFSGIRKVTHTAHYEVTLTRGADPAVVAAEKERLATPSPTP